MGGGRLALSAALDPCNTVRMPGHGMGSAHASHLFRSATRAMVMLFGPQGSKYVSNTYLGPKVYK